MVWVDRIIEQIQERFAKEIAQRQPLLIRDEKTLSGRVHVGSLRGIVIHGLIAQVLAEKGIVNSFRFELNDFDPMDELPMNLRNRENFLQYMGQPLYTVPSPVEGLKNYPTVFGTELQSVVSPVGIPIEYYELTPHYKRGDFNGVIREALDHAVEIRAIYREVSGSKKPEDWYPLQVICEQCGKVGTTQVTAWDREKVTYICKSDLVTWAKGCGHEGTISPFDGRAKLPWKVEWPAKWKVFGVHIEGAGKDHGAAGGSRDIGRRISEEIFHYREPFNIPYEFFNIGGKKMSASKGLGVSAKEIADLLPPMLLKLLMIRKMPNQPIDFDPEGTTIPTLFDEYDRLSDHFFKRHPEPDADFARTFRLTQLDPSTETENLWQMRFTTLSFVLQMPHLNLLEEAAKLKDASNDGRGALRHAEPVTLSGVEGRSMGRPELSPNEKKSLEERAHYVRQWLQAYAPAEYKYTILSTPPKNLTLDAEQSKALTTVHAALSEKSLPWEGPKIHECIHAVKAELEISPQKLFQPLYEIFLGRKSGPQVGWFLSTFPREEVLKRLSSL